MTHIRIFPLLISIMETAVCQGTFSAIFFAETFLISIIENEQEKRQVTEADCGTEQAKNLLPSFCFESENYFSTSNQRADDQNVCVSIRRLTELLMVIALAAFA